MKKVHYLIWFALFVITGIPVGGQTQKTWEMNGQKSTVPRSSPYVAGSERGVAFRNGLPNVSIRKNPLQKVAFAVAADGKDLYGFSMTNMEDESFTGIVRFNTSSPSTVVHIGRSAEWVRAGAYANDKYYLIALDGLYPKGLYTADITTGELTLVADYMHNENVRGSMDMSYDYSTETMYMLTNSDKVSGASALRTVDLKTGEQGVVTDDMGRYVRTLSVNMEGEMYGIDGDGMLCKIDKKTGKGTDIGSTGRQPLFFQTMEFDRETGVLYWLACDADHYSELCTVDPGNGTTTSLGLIGTGEGEQIVALYVPFKLSEPGAPAKVSGLSVVPDAKGENRAEIGWTNPDKTYEGGELATIDKVELFRNGELIQTWTGVRPGTKSGYTDQVPEAGIYTYKVVPHNSAGAGVAKSVSRYIGHDLPAAVHHAKAVRVNKNSVALTWDAATAGINNGYVDLSSVRYKVTRLNDHKVLAEALAETSFTDDTILELARYTYQIEVFNSDGKGGVTTTNYVVTGPAQELPLFSDFAKETDAGLWTCIDNNGDGNTFALMYNYSTKATEYVYATSFDLQADDWLVSPVVNIRKGKYYKVVVGAKIGYAVYPERFSIYLIKDMDIANAVKLGEDFVIDVERVVVGCRVNIDDAEGGEYSIGIRCTSPAASDHFAVTAVAIEENHDGNIRGDVWDNKDHPVEGLVVSVEGTDFNALTNDKGQFEIKNVPAGDYALRCTKLGYKDTPYAVTVKELETQTVELNVTIREQSVLSGFVKNEYGRGLPDVNVNVSGYHTYATKSDGNGAFRIEGVYEAADAYQVIASKAFYQNATENALDTGTGFNLNLTLNDKILAPATVNAIIEDGARVPAVRWVQPGEDLAVVLHSDEFSSTLGAQDGDAHTLLGLMCRQPFALEELNWKVFIEDETINVVVLGLDETGKVTSEVLYIDEEASNVPYESTNYRLKERVIAPRGCFIGLSRDSGSLSLLTVSNDEEHPFVPQLNGVIDDYTQSAEVQFTENLGEGYDENFYMDYKGMLLADEGAPSVTYKVYRKDGNAVESALTPDPLSVMSLQDAAWNTLADGVYHYSVEAVYENAKVSGRTESNALTKSRTGIRESEATKSYAEVSADQTRLIFSRTVDFVEIITVSGTIVQKGKHVSSLPITNLGAGIYMVRMQNDHTCHTQKIIIK